METREIKALKTSLKELNKDNYSKIKLGLQQRVNDVERVLFRIEMFVFKNTDIQNKEWEKYVLENGGKQ